MAWRKDGNNGTGKVQWVYGVKQSRGGLWEMDTSTPELWNVTWKPTAKEPLKIYMHSAHPYAHACISNIFMSIYAKRNLVEIKSLVNWLQCSISFHKNVAKNQWLSSQLKFDKFDKNETFSFNVM